MNLHVASITLLNVVLMFVAYRVIDWLTPQVNFNDELKRGNVAVAIFK